MSLYAVVLIECFCLSNTMQEFPDSQFDRIFPSFGKGTKLMVSNGCAGVLKGFH
jgi:hypothetical protein